MCRSWQTAFLLAVGPELRSWPATLTTCRTELVTPAGLGIWLAVLPGWFLSQRAVLEEEQILGLCRYREASLQPYSNAENRIQPTPPPPWAWSLAWDARQSLGKSYGHPSREESPWPHATTEHSLQSRPTVKTGKKCQALWAAMKNILWLLRRKASQQAHPTAKPSVLSPDQEGWPGTSGSNRDHSVGRSVQAENWARSTILLLNMSPASQVTRDPAHPTSPFRRRAKPAALSNCRAWPLVLSD